MLRGGNKMGTWLGAAPHLCSEREKMCSWSYSTAEFGRQACKAQGGDTQGCPSLLPLSWCLTHNLLPLLHQGIHYLIEHKVLSSDLQDIAKFLYKGEGLNKTAIGDYLGER